MIILLLGWKNTIYGDYKLFPEKCETGCSFDEAAAICKAEGAHLPFIMNEEENLNTQVRK